MQDKTRGKVASGDLDFGPCISDEEFQRQIADLYAGMPPVPSRVEDVRLRRRELDLRIDHRLGCEFPAERREALWLAQQQIERQRLQNMGRAFLANLLPAGRRAVAGSMSRFLVKAYRGVLSPPELERFLNLGKGEPVPLPVDDDGLSTR